VNQFAGLPVSDEEEEHGQGNEVVRGKKGSRKAPRRTRGIRFTVFENSTLPSVHANTRRVMESIASVCEAKNGGQKVIDRMHNILVDCKTTEPITIDPSIHSLEALALRCVASDTQEIAAELTAVITDIQIAAKVHR